MGRNYGLGSRDMFVAGKFALRKTVIDHHHSFATEAVLGERWRIFSEWAREKKVKKMEYVTQELVRQYGENLAHKVKEKLLSASTAQVYLSAVNTVMSIATKNQWETVSAVSDCGIPKRSAVRETAPGGLDERSFENAVVAVQEKMGERLACVIMLSRMFGLRSKEASLLNSKIALEQANSAREVTIMYGSKGGRERKVPVISDVQIRTLKRAAENQGNDLSMIPEGQSWKVWQGQKLRSARKIVNEFTGGGLHDLRAAYACERYFSITGHPAPALGAKISDKTKDFEARKIISIELGHNRIDVVAEYVGGRR